MNNIRIDLDRQLGTIDRNIFGGFAEHLGRCIYGGIYEPGSPLADEDGLRRDVLDALRRLRMPIIRYPGGNFVSGYRWRDGVGPAAERQPRLDLAWNAVEPNAFGTNEFVRFCRKIGAEPYIAVNCGDGDMREARDWVEYCNGTQETALVRLRRKHGFEAPHKVRYWGIGNEVDGPWQIGMKTPQEYARAYTEFAKVMRLADKEIRLLASVTSSWKDDWVERAQLLLEQAPGHVDYMAIHWYVGNRDNNFANYMALSELFESRLAAMEGMIRAMTLARNIKHPVHIAVDEWNVWYRKGGAEALEEIYNLEDALVVGMHLNAFIRHARTVRMANLAQIVNVIAPIFTRPDGLFLQPTFFPLEAYSRACGDTALDVHWAGDTFEGGGRTGIRVLDVAATLDGPGRRLVLHVVNRTADRPTEAEVSLVAGQFAGPVKTTVINGPDIKAMNSFDKPNVVASREAAAAARAQTLACTFEPHSVTVLECALAK